MEPPLDPNPAIVAMFRHLTEVCNKKANDPNFQNASTMIYRETLREKEPKNTSPHWETRIRDLAEKFSFKVTENSHSLTLTFFKQ